MDCSDNDNWLKAFWASLECNDGSRQKISIHYEHESYESALRMQWSGKGRRKVFQLAWGRICFLHPGSLKG